MRRNHLKFREVLGEKKVHDKYVDDFVVQIHDLLDA